MEKTTTNEKGTANAPKTQVYNLIILDKSGSMNSISDAAISGFNETIGGIRSAQEKFGETQEHFVSLMLFCGCDKRMVYDSTPIAEVKDLTSREYSPCCNTPLYDAMGISLTALFNKIREMENATAVVTVITDGMENSSREFDGKSVKALVEKLTNEEGWQFAYIGTNQNVEEVSSSLSISSSLSFVYNGDGMRDAWRKERNSKMRMYDSLNAGFACESAMSPMERKASRAKMHQSLKFFWNREDIKDRITPDRIGHLADNEVIVFGSDISGTHAGGLAQEAVMHFGAVRGCAEGLQGKSYAIPTTGVSSADIGAAVERFINFAMQHPETKFLVTRIGCGNAGHPVEEIANMFVSAQKFPNICLPEDFWNAIL